MEVFIFFEVFGYSQNDMVVDTDVLGVLSEQGDMLEAVLNGLCVCILEMKGRWGNIWNLINLFRGLVYQKRLVEGFKRIEKFS